MSVRSGTEARAALEGGADLIDCKDPDAGALGPVSPSVFREITLTVDHRRPITAAMGDATSVRDIEADAAMFARGGSSLVKLGFAGVGTSERAIRLLEAAVSGAAPGACGVVAVAYADYEHVGSFSPTEVLAAARRAGAAGLLIDTADKQGPGLTGLATRTTLRRWIDRAHDDGLLLALAGKISEADLDVIGDLGADVVGVRGSACEGGRGGVIVAAKIHRLRQRLDQIAGMVVRKAERTASPLSAVTTLDSIAGRT